MSPLSATPAGRLLRPSLVGQNRKGDHDGRHLKEGRADHQKPDFMLRLRVHGVITPKALDRSALSPRPRRNKNQGTPPPPPTWFFGPQWSPQCAAARTVGRCHLPTPEGRPCPTAHDLQAFLCLIHIRYSNLTGPTRGPGMHIACRAFFIDRRPLSCTVFLRI